VSFAIQCLTWDCPCHGAQFAPDGTALNGPAFSPLEAIKPSIRPPSADKAATSTGSSQRFEHGLGPRTRPPRVCRYPRGENRAEQKRDKRLGAIAAARLNAKAGGSKSNALANAVGQRCFG
jgi:hypothetical protein